jgi:hypothetical protein
MAPKMTDFTHQDPAPVSGQKPVGVDHQPEHLKRTYTAFRPWA